MATVVKDIVTWLKQWFYTESEVDTITGGLQTQINNKADTSTVTGKADKSNGASQITDANANTYTNISSSLTSSSTQADINSAINVRIGKLMDLDWIVVVSTLPTASASTLGRLYLVAISGSGDNNFKEYVTVKDETTTPVSYSWEKLGEISGSGLSVDWSDITNKPSSFTPSSHTHGNITNDGKVGSTSGKPLITTTGGAVTTGAFGTSSGQFAEGNHTHSDKADKTSALGTTITLVDAGETNEGCIIFNTIS